MNITVTVAGTDRTSQIEWKTFDIEDNVNEEANLCYFKYKKYGDRTFIPAVGEAIEVTDGSDKLFSGTITRIKNEASKGVITYSVTAKDHTEELDRIFVIDRYEDMTVTAIIQSIIDDYNTNVTYTNVDCPITIESVAFNRLPISKCLQILAEQVNYSWYIDYDKDIHFFSKNTEPAPYNLDTSSGNFIYDSLHISIDNSQLKNRVTIRGAEREATNTRTKEWTTNATGQKTFGTDYKFSSKPTVTVDSVSKTVGTENIDTVGFDCYWDYNQKYIRFDTAPASGALIEITAKPLIPIVAQVEDAGSIGTYGVHEFLRIDTSITTSDEAKLYAQAQLEMYGKSLRNGGFRTEKPGLVSGQTISINIPSRGLANTYVIQRVTLEMKSPTEAEYQVEVALLRDLGMIKFLQGLILDKTKEIVLNENEVLEKAYFVIEDVSVTEEITKRTPTQVQEEIEITEDCLKDPFGADTPPDFVLAPYTPTSNTDPKREFVLDRSRLG